MPRIKTLGEQYLMARRYGAEAFGISEGMDPAIRRLDMDKETQGRLKGLYDDLQQVWGNLALALDGLETREDAIRDEYAKRDRR